MEWVQITAATEEEALDRALDELGVPRDEAEWEVLATPKARLGGLLGRSEARIRARVKPKSREKPQNRTPRRKGGRRAERTGKGDGRGDGSGGGKSRGGNGRGGSKGESARKERSASEGNRPHGDQQEDDGRSRGRRRGRGGTAVSENDERPSVPLGEQADAAADFARGLVEAFGADADVEVEVDDDDVIRLAIVGSELGLLVGPRGATISGIEELVRTMLQRLTGGQSARVRVDVDGYRERRREALAEFTRELVAKVQDSGREQALEPMGAADRKVVHDVVAPLDDVTTVSEGEEPRRRVVIRRAD